MLFFGTLIYNGCGKGVVFATGDDTFFAQTTIKKQSRGTVKNTKINISDDITNFIFKVSCITLVVAVLLFTISLIQSNDIIHSIVIFIGIIVGFVTPGLLIVITVCLILATKYMHDSIHLRARNLESIIKLGTTNVICTDKTGVLTTGVMTAQHVNFDLENTICDTSLPMKALNGDFYDTYDNDEDGKRIRKSSFLRLIRCATLCNNTRVDDQNRIDLYANRTESAIIKFACGHIEDEYRLTVPQYRLKHKKLHEIPFNSKNKWQLSIHELPKDFCIGRTKSEHNGNNKKQVWFTFMLLITITFVVSNKLLMFYFV